MEDFDPCTTQYDPRNALWLGQAAALAYDMPDQACQQLATAGLDRFTLLVNTTTDTQGYIAGNDDMVLIAFRGTVASKFKDWLTDLDAVHVAGPQGQVHKGFYERGLLSVWDQLAAALPAYQCKNQPIWLTGHSLGAAIADLAAAELITRKLVASINGLYTFGQPRAGNSSFSVWLNSQMLACSFRFVHDNDIVPHVPLAAMAYQHNGTFIHFDANDVIHTEESVWSRLKDALAGRVEDLWQHGIVPPEIEDHFIANYIDALQKNIANNPFSKATPATQG